LPDGRYLSLSGDTETGNEASPVMRLVYKAGATLGWGRLDREAGNNGCGIIGQSFISGGAYSQPPVSVSAENPETSRMLTAEGAGMLDGPMYKHLVGEIVATGFEPLKSGTVETILPGLAARLQAKELAEFDQKRSWLFGGSARTGQEFLALDRGTVPYNGYLDMVRWHRDLSLEEGRAYHHRLIVVGHGSQDYSSYNEFARYFTNLKEWRRSLVEDVRELLPAQPMDPLFVILQNPRSIQNVNLWSEIKQAQLEFARCEPGVIWGGTWYQHEPNSLTGDNTHPGPLGMRHMGEDVGEAAKNALEGWTRPPVEIQEVRRRTATQWELIFTEDVAIDTSGAIINTTDIRGQHGLVFLDDETEIVPSSFTIDGTDARKGLVTLPSAPTGLMGWFLLAHHANLGGGKPMATAGARCLVHATADQWASIHDGKSMRRWAAAQRLRAF